MNELWAFANRHPWPATFMVSSICYAMYRIVDSITGGAKRVAAASVDDDDDDEIC